MPWHALQGQPAGAASTVTHTSCLLWLPHEIAGHNEGTRWVVAAGLTSKQGPGGDLRWCIPCHITSLHISSVRRAVSFQLLHLQSPAIISVPRRRSSAIVAVSLLELHAQVCCIQLRIIILHAHNSLRFLHCQGSMQLFNQGRSVNDYCTDDYGVSGLLR